MDIREFQSIIVRTYGERDGARGTEGTFRWLVEEVGELARALRSGDRVKQLEEFSDVLAWLVSLAALCGVDMAEAMARYARGCPKCKAIPCACPGEARS